MKVRISYTVEISDEQRRAICHAYGHKGKATRQEIKEFFQNMGSGNCVLDDYVSEMRRDLAEPQ